jgi:hypothetical protein
MVLQRMGLKWNMAYTIKSGILSQIINILICSTVALNLQGKKRQHYSQFFFGSLEDWQIFQNNKNGLHFWFSRED